MIFTRFKARLDRWNQRDRKGMMLFATTLLFGFVLPLIIYGVTAYLMHAAESDTEYVLFLQIQEFLSVLSYTAFYAGLFVGILNRIPFWKNLLSILAPFVSQSAYILFLNWSMVVATEEADPNLSYNQIRLFIKIAVCLVTPLLWLLICYLVRLIKTKPLYLNIGLMVLMAIWRALPKILAAGENSSYYFQTETTYSITYAVLAGLVFAVGFFVYKLSEKEMNAPAHSDWAKRNSDDTTKREEDEVNV